MSNFERGSEWRQWDLHLHTKSSYDYKYKSEDADQLLCDALKKNNIAAVAITDHFVIDRTGIEKLRILAPNITFFPGVELRTDKGADNLHIIIVFNDKLNLKDLEEDFSAIMIRDKRKGNNDDEYYWEYDNIIKFANARNGIIIIHAGSKTNGLDEQITNAVPFTRAIKEDISNNINIFEMGKLKDFEDYRNHVFKRIPPRGMILCSDNHDPRNYSRKEKLWIKADTTFEGLKNAVNDYENRIFVGDIPDKLSTVNYNKTKYIDSIEINKIDNKTPDIWFDNIKLNFNKDLIAIIGNKGNGKSALADIIAHNANHKGNFSFLTTNKFLNNKYNIAKNYESKLLWEEDSLCYTKNLVTDNDEEKTELVKYIPQSYLEEICNKIIADEKNPFITELEKIIFSHIPDSERLGCANINDLREKTTEAIRIEKNKLLEELKKLNKEASDYIYKISEEYKKSIEINLENKKRELESLKNSKPEAVSKPEEDEILKQKQSEILNEIQEFESKKDELINKKESYDKELSHLNIVIQNINDIISKSKIIKSDIDKYKEDVKKLISDNNINYKVEDIITFEIKEDLIQCIYNNYKDEKSEIISKFNEEVGNSYDNKIMEIDKKIEELSDNLNEPNKSYQKYESELNLWKRKVKNIKEDINKPDTIKYYNKELEKISDDYPNKIKSLELKRDLLIVDIYRKINDEITTLKKHYNSVQKFIDDNKKIIDNINMKFDVSIICDNFKDTFLSYIDMSKSGTYYRNDKKVDELLSESSFNTYENTYTFIKNVMQSLYNDHNNITRQLKNKDKLDELLNYIYSFEYLTVQYELKLGEKSLEELSPGEKGLLLLVFYLLIDKNDCPLILDQPEENLYNDTIIKTLVPCILEAKKRRQIFMVTHNPNLAVVCDAEQIIYCEIQKDNKNKVIYNSGSLENSNINRKVTDILEGTLNAFNIRDSRYQKPAK